MTSTLHEPNVRELLEKLFNEAAKDEDRPAREVPRDVRGRSDALADVYTNANDPTRLAIPCTAVHSAGSQFDGCPDHMTVATGASPIAGQKAVTFDVAAWSDLWFYANPIYIEVAGSTPVAGVQ